MLGQAWSESDLIFAPKIKKKKKKVPGTNLIKIYELNLQLNQSRLSIGFAFWVGLVFVWCPAAVHTAVLLGVCSLVKSNYKAASNFPLRISLMWTQYYTFFQAMIVGFSQLPHAILWIYDETPESWSVFLTLFRPSSPAASLLYLQTGLRLRNKMEGFVCILLSRPSPPTWTRWFNCKGQERIFYILWTAKIAITMFVIWAMNHVENYFFLFYFLKSQPWHMLGILATG